MIKNKKIEDFFGTNNWKNLLEVFPVGVLVFDSKFRIKQINKNFKELLFSSKNIKELQNKYMLDDSLFRTKLPFVDILKISKGKSFEKIINNNFSGKDKLNLVIKGTPIINENEIIGGFLIVEDFQIDKKNRQDYFSYSIAFESFIKNLCDCYLIINAEGNIKYSSGSVKSECEFLVDGKNKNITEIFNNSSKNEIESVITKTISEQKKQFLKLYYYSVVTKVTLSSVFIPFPSQNKEDDLIIVLLKENGKENKNNINVFDNQDELKEYFLLAQASADCIFKTNLHGNIIFWTSAAEEFFGISKTEIDSKFINRIFPQIDEVYFEKIRNDLLLNKKWEEKILIEKNGNTFWINIKIVFLPNKNNLIFYCNLIDENSQKIEHAKNEEMKFFKEAVLKSDEMILQLDAYGTISFVNEKFRKTLGYDIDEISGIPFTDLIDIKFKIENKISEMITLVSNRLEIIPLIAKSRKLIEVCINFNITHQGESLKYYTVFLKECSKEKEIQSQLTETLLQESIEAIAVLHKNKILKANNQFLELFGYEKITDVVNNNIQKIVKTNQTQELENILLRKKNSATMNIVSENKKQFEIEIKRIDKNTPKDITILVFNRKGQKISALPKEINYLENLTTNLNEFLWSAKNINNDLNIEFVSPGVTKVTGYSQMEFIANPVFWKKIIHPEDINKVQNNIKELLASNKSDLKEILHRIIKKDGDTIWLETKIKIVRNSEGNILEIFGSSSDITEKENEIEKLKEELKKLKEENRTKDKFISIISHDLRSPFTSILGFTELIASDDTLDKEEIKEYVANIREASKNTLNLVNSLLDWTRLQTGRIDIVPEIVNANYLVRKTIAILSGVAMQKGIALKSHIDESVYITADENILSQVFNNLVSNAIKFTPKGGRIDIYAKKIEDKQKVQFIVKDTGIGIEEKDIPKLFLVDKKFTTLGTEGEKGTGLGLSLVKEIITKHNGEIFVKSEIGKGTEFIFTIPVSSPSILLVDNLQNERILYSKLFQSITNNIDILTAAEPEEALKIIKEKMPMLIVTENNLSKIKGFEFIEKIKSSGIKYNPHFIILAKNITKEAKEKYQKLGIENIYTKPVDLKELKAALDKIIVKN